MGGGGLRGRLVWKGDREDQGGDGGSSGTFEVRDLRDGGDREEDANIQTAPMGSWGFAIELTAILSPIDD
jgi:hypothetical protein